MEPVRFKPIEGYEGYEGLYSISDNGMVYSHRKKAFLMPHRMGKGSTYLQIQLWKSGRFESFRVHALVARAFVPNPDNLPEVNHKDGVKSNNVYTNLEWTTHLSNMRHAG